MDVWSMGQLAFTGAGGTEDVSGQRSGGGRSQPETNIASFRQVLVSDSKVRPDPEFGS